MTADRTPPVTGPTPPDDDVTGRLAEFARQCWWAGATSVPVTYAEEHAVATVRALMDEHAAKKLNDAADALPWWETLTFQQHRAHVTWLRDRARTPTARGTT